MATIGEQRNIRFQRVIDHYWPARGAVGTASTFDLYRRQRSDVPNYLGVPTDGWEKIVAAQPCTVINVKVKGEDGFEIVEQGQIQKPLLEIHCSITTIVQGDNLVLNLDGLAYQIYRVVKEGGVSYLLCDHSQAQIKGPNG